MIDDFYDPDARPVEAINVPPRKGLPYLQQPSKWTCMVASFAMVLSKHEDAGRLFQDMMEQLGRDDERGYHVQEFLGIGISLGVAFVPFEFDPQVERAPCAGGCHYGKVEKPVGTYGDPAVFDCDACNGTGLQPPAPLVAWKATEVMQAHDGVLLGRRKGATHPHAVAWCSRSKQVLDPEMGIYGFDGFEPDTFWAAFKLGK